MGFLIAILIIGTVVAVTFLIFSGLKSLLKNFNSILKFQLNY